VIPRGRLRSALERVSLVRLLIGLGIVLVAINIGAAVWDAYSDRVRIFHDVQRDVSNITSLLAEQTATGLEAVDLMLRDVQRMGTAAAIAKQQTRLRDELASVPQITAILVFDEKGRVVGRTNDTPTIDSTQRPRPFFNVHAEGKVVGLYVSDPYLGGRENSSWRFVLSRRLSGLDGAFAGVVAAIVEVETYERLYRGIDLGEGGFISLVNADGLIFTRVPPAEGKNVEWEAVLDPVRRDGRFDGRTQSPLLQEPVVISVARVRGGFPLFVATGKKESAVLAAWHKETRLTTERTILTSVAMLALVMLAAWGLQRRERALQASEKRFRAMIEHSNDAIVLTNPLAGGVFYVSPHFTRVTGYTFDEVRGRQLPELAYPEHQDQAARLRTELLRAPGTAVSVEVKLRHRNGSAIWTDATITNLLDEPSVGGLVVNLRDITERKLAEAERSRLEHRLRQAAKMEAVGRLAGGIAHDFNNILGGILGYAEMLIESAPEGSAQRRYAQNVLTAAQPAGAHLDHIQTKSPSQRANRLAVDLGGIVAETLDLVRGSLKTGIELRSTLPEKSLYVIADPTQVHQILMNLCTNAIHAIGERGELRVTMEPTDAAEERVFAHTTLPPGRYALLKVEDTGSGMDSATLARLFEPFFTTKDVGKGTGLGLSLVYGIVTDSGGAIEVTSRVGRGSCFAV
jgi:PAS domain S-box-containing protein